MEVLLPRMTVMVLMVGKLLVVVDGVVDDEGRAGRFTGERGAGQWERTVVMSGELFSLAHLLPCFTSLTFNHVRQLGRGYVCQRG
jgi:hypothetical protein